MLTIILIGLALLALGFACGLMLSPSLPFPVIFLAESHALPFYYNSLPDTPTVGWHNWTAQLDWIMRSEHMPLFMLWFFEMPAVVCLGGFLSVPVKAAMERGSERRRQVFMDTYWDDYSNMRDG